MSSYTWGKNVNLDSQKWYHLVLTWDKENNVGKLYLDGKSIHKDTFIIEDWDLSDQRFFWSGSFNGGIDEVSLYQGVLSPENVFSIFEQERLLSLFNMNVLFRSGFENEIDDFFLNEIDSSPQWEAWDIERAVGASHALLPENNVVASGNQSLKVHLKSTDEPTLGGKRAEITLPKVDFPEKTYVYKFKVYLPEDWQLDSNEYPEIIAQWHGWPDLHLGETWRSPPLSIMLRDNKWVIETRWDPKAITINNNPRHSTPKGDFQELWESDYTNDRGRWTDWLFKVKWSYTETGELLVYKNNKMVLNHSGPNMYNDVEGPYFKIGVYKRLWSNAITDRILYFDDVIVAE